MRQISGIGQQVRHLTNVSRQAMALDQAEAHMVLQSNVLTSMSCTYDAAMAMVKRDRQGAVDRMSGAISRILVTHQWLEKSLHSDQALDEALTTWQEAYQRSLRIRSQLEGLNKRGVEWTGASAEGRKVRVLDALKAQSELCEQINHLIEGCQEAKSTLTDLVHIVHVMVTRAKHTMQGTVLRGPSAHTSMFALNSRTKAAASVLEGLANDYEAQRTSGAWLPTSYKIAGIFRDNAAALSAVRAYPGRNIAV